MDGPRRTLLLVEHAQCAETRELVGVSEVVTTAEGVSGAGQDDHPERVLLVERQCEVLEFDEHRVRHRVGSCRSVQRHQRHAWGELAGRQRLVGRVERHQEPLLLVHEAALEPLSMLGGRHVDQPARPLLDGAPGEKRRAVLGDDGVHVDACRGDHAATQPWVDRGSPRYLRPEGDDRAGTRERGRTGEVDLAANRTDVYPATHLGAHLAEQVDLDGGVDRHQGAQPREHVRGMGVAGGTELDRQGAETVVQRRAAQGGPRDDQAGVDLPAGARHDPLLDQVHHSVGDHAGVDAEVPVTGEGFEHGVGEGPDTDLDRVAIVDQRGHVLGDRPLDLVGLARWRLAQRPVGLHGRRERRRGSSRFLGARHLVVDLGDQGAGVRQARPRRSRHRCPA